MDIFIIFYNRFLFFVMMISLLSKNIIHFLYIPLPPLKGGIIETNYFNLINLPPILLSPLLFLFYELPTL
ncbi:hypothetical protein CCYN49044_60159 [Capnocytophaga cynodegmi]|uniref:Uncharacterized protein n=1 Tax=Capnocytophaga cynodegmi TaxID=28189 RepID=A0A0B7HTY6_9FLAO|nr:hypothetical protein CCYN74_10147 [Capnocytophaga cynodegmi]CEN42064.1 hypothetical protein CCYN49044_60159 [Capnocytophaga cynodegmi]